MTNKTNPRTAFRKQLLELARSRGSPEAAREIANQLSQKPKETLKEFTTLSEDDVSIKKAFAISKLDPNNIMHWKLLFRISTELLVSTGTPGRPKKWTPEFYNNLLLRFNGERDSHPKYSQEKICELLIKQYPEDYSNLDRSTLRRRLGDAATMFGDSYKGNVVAARSAPEGTAPPIAKHRPEKREVLHKIVVELLAKIGSG